MPWGVIMMVCGVTVLIALLEKTQGIDLFADRCWRSCDARDSVTGVVALRHRPHLGLQQHLRRRAAGVSADGAGLIQRLGGGDPMAIASAMNVGGASGRRLAAVDDRRPLHRGAVSGDDSRRLFNQLLTWGLSMTVVGALICYLLFGR